jgi:hypothetical protein
MSGEMLMASAASASARRTSNPATTRCYGGLGDQRGIGLAQVDEIDIVRHRALPDRVFELGEETVRKIVPRHDRDINVAVVPRFAAGAGTNSHTAASCSPSASSTMRRNSSIACLRVEFTALLARNPQVGSAGLDMSY